MTKFEIANVIAAVETHGAFSPEAELGEDFSRELRLEAMAEARLSKALATEASAWAAKVFCSLQERIGAQVTLALFEAGQNVHVSSTWTATILSAVPVTAVAAACEAGYPSAYAAVWKHRVGFIPKQRSLRENPEAFMVDTESEYDALEFDTGDGSMYPYARKAWGALTEIVEHYTDDLLAHEVHAAIKIVMAFGRRWREWVERFDSLQRAGLNLPKVPIDPKWSTWALKEVDQWSAIEVLRNLPRVLRQGGHPGHPTAKLVGMAQRVWFGDEPIAVEAARWSVREDLYYNEILPRWEAHSLECTIPNARATDGEYVLETLSKLDPRGLFLGQYTNCCQHPDGAGASSAWHGVESADGGFLVLSKGGKIVAQSWVWRRGSRLCLDNIEVLGGVGRLNGVLHLYRQVCAQWGAHGFNQVNLGMQYVEDTETFESLPEAYWDGFMDTPEGVYTDASNSQRVLWQAV